MLDMSHTLKFRKSSYSSGGQENCVEVTGSADGAAVRDTQHRESGYLTYPPTEWAALLGMARK